jgi:hypothetical protein
MLEMKWSVTQMGDAARTLFTAMKALEKPEWLLYTVRTVAGDLHRGEHIPKMQNNIGRKSMLRVLRQLRSKDGGGGGGWVPYRAGPCRAVFGLALRSPQVP